ncbi:hypothetical protein [Legionella feeleii]|uniref:Serine/threonine protein kinase n=1 Tax=Legionella feeleii TaxID=453 RepID=A0A378IPJ1_9GAMM|nr:hypothetical protein [Legionella feeleii]STX36860.1 serine/threonine protein kinase [Legionella feeleii]
MRIKDKGNPLYWPNIPKESLTELSKGNFANARVFRYSRDGIQLTIKNFEHCPWWIRLFISRAIIKIEYHCLNRLKGLAGLTSQVMLLDKYTVAFSYIAGVPLKTIYKKGKRLPKEFFLEMERRVCAIHSKGQVHLDLRNLGNIIHGEDETPYLIDFQSSLRTTYIPKKLCAILEEFDLSGIYKCWELLCEEPLDTQREALLRRLNKLRRYWIFKKNSLRKKIKENS